MSLIVVPSPSRLNEAPNLPIPERIRGYCRFEGCRFLVARSKHSDPVVLSFFERNRTAYGLVMVLTDDTGTSDAGDTPPAASETEARDHLMTLLSIAGEQGVNDIQLYYGDNLAQVQLARDGYLVPYHLQFTPTEMEAIYLSVFYLSTSGASVRQPGEIQTFACTDGKILPRHVIGLRVQQKPESGRWYQMNIRLHLDHVQVGLTKLGHCPWIVRRIRRILRSSSGVFTVGAPTGQGKTVTLHESMVDLYEWYRSQGRGIFIGAVGDPIEIMDHERIRASDVVLKHGKLDYSSQINALLRNDPHVVMLNECRLAEAGRAAFEIADYGKTAGVTIHAVSAAAIVSRYLMMGVPLDLVRPAEFHLGWLSQRLIGKLCPHCAIPAEQSDLEGVDEMLEEFGQIWRIREGALKMPGPGCAHCLSQRIGVPGIRGRFLVSELIEPTQAMIDLMLSEGNAMLGVADRVLKVWLSGALGYQRQICREAPPSMQLKGLSLLLEGRIGLSDYIKTLGSAVTLERHLACSGVRVKDFGHAA